MIKGNNMKENLNSAFQRLGNYAFNPDAVVGDAWNLLKTNKAVLVDGETGMQITDFGEFKQILANRNATLNPGITDKMRNYLDSLIQAGIYLKQPFNYPKVANQSQYIYNPSQKDVSNGEPYHLTGITITQPVSNQINYQSIPKNDLTAINNFLAGITDSVRKQPTLKDQILQALSTAFTNPAAVQDQHPDVQYGVGVLFSLENETSKQFMIQQVGAMR